MRLLVGHQLIQWLTSFQRHRYAVPFAFDVYAVSTFQLVPMPVPGKGHSLRIHCCTSGAPRCGIRSSRFHYFSLLQDEW